MTTISLKPITEEAFKAYMKVALLEYAAEKKKGENLTDEQALKVASDSFHQLLPNGISSPDQFLFSIVDDHSNILGTVWLGQKKLPRPHVWIYDIVLNPDARGRGYGRKTMALIEAEVLKLGVKSIGLHVFGHNTVAQSLYEKAGFRTTNRIMVKDL